MKVRLNAVAFAAAALALGQSAWAGEAEAKKWIDTEFQPLAKPTMRYRHCATPAVWRRTMPMSR